MTVAGWAERPADGLFCWRTDEPKDWETSAAVRNPRAAQVLIASAIPLEEAFKRGIRWVPSIMEITRLRREFGGKGIPPEGDSGLVFPHYALTGQRTLQYRPDQPYSVQYADGTLSKPRKYDWGQSGASGISIGYNAATRIANRTARRLAIPEGTRQAISADIWAPQDTDVVGIQGIWNGQKNGVLLADLEALAPQYEEIIIIPDGDVTSNPHVWDGADLLRALLHARAPGAAIRVAVLPADGKEGLDDILGRVAEGERTQYLADLFGQAGVMPPRPGGTKTVTPLEERSIWQRFDAAVDAADTVAAVYGGILTEEGLETAEGILAVGRFRDGAGFVKATEQGAAALLHIPVGKVSTASTVLIGAVGGKGAYRIIDAHKDALEDIIPWLEEHADDIDAGVRSLTTEADQRREKKAQRREHREIVKAFNALYRSDELGVDPREYPRASDAARAYARRKKVDPYEVMEALIGQRVSSR